VERGGDDHHVINREAVALGEPQSRFVCLKGERMDLEQAARQVEIRMRVGPGHPHLAACDAGEFVENLDADRAAGCDNRLGAVGLRDVARGDVDEDRCRNAPLGWARIGQPV
jgi:hypothetical protein